MTRQARIIRWVVGGLFASGAAVVGWTLWLIDGQMCWIEWETDGGGLILSYFPGKQQVILDATDSYVPGSAPRWTMVEPGTSNRWLGAPRVPPVEELFARAGVTCNARRSTPKGLIAFYADADDLKKLGVACALEFAYERGDRAVIDEARAKGNYPWLEDVIDRATANLPAWKRDVAQAEKTNPNTPAVGDPRADQK